MVVGRKTGEKWASLPILTMQRTGRCDVVRDGKWAARASNACDSRVPAILSLSKGVQNLLFPNEDLSCNPCSQSFPWAATDPNPLPNFLYFFLLLNDLSFKVSYSSSLANLCNSELLYTNTAPRIHTSCYSWNPILVSKNPSFSSLNSKEDLLIMPLHLLDPCEFPFECRIPSSFLWTDLGNAKFGVCLLGRARR